MSGIDTIAYIYGVLAHPAYQARHEEQLMAKEIRVPLTKDPTLFDRAARIGKRLLWLHSYAARFTEEFGKELPPGSAKCHEAPSGRDDEYPNTVSYDPESRMITIGEGEQAGRYGPVAPELWDFEVSGLKVVQSWLGYRMRERKGKKTSPLDKIGPTEWTWEFNTELLELLAVLEETLKAYPRQAALLEEIEAGPLFTADELPDVPPEARKPMAPTPLFDDED